MTALRILLAGALALAVAALPSTAAATFTRAATAALSVSSDILAPPTAVAVACRGSASRATVSWTATVDAYATGYLVHVAAGGTDTSQAVAGGSTTSIDTSIPVAAGAAVTVVSTYRGWTSARSVGVTAPKNCH
jgi:hypothetical protein